MKTLLESIQEVINEESNAQKQAKIKMKSQVKDLALNYLEYTLSAGFTAASIMTGNYIAAIPNTIATIQSGISGVNKIKDIVKTYKKANQSDEEALAEFIDKNIIIAKESIKKSNNTKEKTKYSKILQQLISARYDEKGKLLSIKETNDKLEEIMGSIKYKKFKNDAEREFDERNFKKQEKILKKIKDKDLLKSRENDKLIIKNKNKNK